MYYSRYLIVLCLLCLTSLTKANVCSWTLDPLFNGTQFNTSFYCGSDITTYSVSNYSLQNYKALHNAAQNLYMQVANRWYMNGMAGLAGPGNDCLGIARTVICAYTFSACFENIGDVNTVCGFLCDLWYVRCPSETDLYNMMCFNRGDSPFCSTGERLTISIFLLIAFIIQLYVLG